APRRRQDALEVDLARGEISHCSLPVAICGSARGACPVRAKNKAASKRSVIVLSLLPFATLQAEPGDHDRSQQERDHGAGNRSALAQLAADDGALIGQG